MSRPSILLPPTYYHDHFREMIDFVASVYGAVLSPDHRGFMTDFLKLGNTSQCVYIRMINRKKAIFGARDFNYAEIDDIAGGLEELRAHGFVRDVAEQDYRGVLHDWGKPDLLDLIRRQDLPGVRLTAPKPQIVAHIHAHVGFDVFSDAFDLHSFVVPAHRDVVAFLLYLYFGKLNDNLTSFTLRDMGIVSVKTRESYQARFASIDEAQAGFFYTQALRDLKAMTPLMIEDLADSLASFPPADGDFTLTLRDRWLFALGQALEKQKDVPRAIAVYEQSTAFDSHERVVRLLYIKGDTDRVRAMLESMMAEPSHDEEYIFASDFYARKFGQKRTGVFTDLLRDSETIAVDDLYRGYPEQAAIRHFEAQGWTAHHSENGLWTALFGLLFWDELYEGEGGLTCGFDRVPHMLKNKTFHIRFAAEIIAKLAEVEAGRAMAIIGETVAAHSMEDNGIFGWHRSLAETLPLLLGASPPGAVARLLEMMTQDFYVLRDGFPDLMLVRGGAIRFVEIKAEGDQIRRHQLARLNLLKRLGYQADICRLTYRIDPDQVYVVVDVETTGGKAAFERVTEIGAVKVRNGETIGEWHSLINPQRRIPAFITQLTGITDAMVRDAPVFADIADDFAAFMEGAVFVAHNVNFDHSFIAQEYRRLDQRFSYPKLCTCASMRRLYPGHGSYGLGPLCADLGIQLDNHHRALDDARAAAALLHMVNHRRMSTQDELKQAS